MRLFLQGHGFVYELENVARMFFGEVSSVEGRPSKEDKAGDYALLRRVSRSDSFELLCLVKCGAFETGRAKTVPAQLGDAECELQLAAMLYDMLCSLFSESPEWGIVTGIRPAKFAGALLERGMSDDEVLWTLETRHRVSRNKAELSLDTAKASRRFAKLNSPKSFSLYVGIPFCPTRCSYCSFVSRSVERDRRLVEPYLAALCEEIAECGRISRELRLRLETVYIGGGTPTVLEAGQLERLAAAIADGFDISSVREYSAEAGRPDTITDGKLAALKKAGVTRLSINPQTGNDDILKSLGRAHTAEQTQETYALARSIGFDNINADLIAGLPGDTPDGFRKSVEWITSLSPENVTVHALTLKRSSRMNELRESAGLGAREMVDFGHRRLGELGYSPYYMYKQKGTVDSLENVGYSKPGRECLYNVYIMEELHTIIACGAGSVTKLVNQKTGLINRIFDYKYPAEYIEGFGEMIKRKQGITEFYEGIL